MTDEPGVPEPARFSGQVEDGQAVPSTTSLTPVPVPRMARRVIGHQIPDDIMQDPGLREAIALLPANYNFEIHKTVWRLRRAGARTVALQFPEGLLMYACVIADILQAHAGVARAYVMGDVTFGACCVDDYSAVALGADFLVHYGHSCLVPVDITSIPCMYVFVDIQMDLQHLVDSVRLTFSPGTNLIMAGTIQFASSLQQARAELSTDFPSLAIPQAAPLSPGEVLGCTAPRFPPGTDALVFLADGRFHLEAAMIANPGVPAYRYDPYARSLTREGYDHEGMQAARREAIQKGARGEVWGLVLGTLGRQGNPALLASLQRLVRAAGKQYIVVLLSEVSPAKLAALSPGVDTWVQVACPRLSIDWGEGFAQPTLNPYEAFVALGEVPGWWEGDGDGEGGAAPYPMDYYSSTGGAWAGTYHRPKPKGSGAAALARLRASRAGKASE
ncbi:hypothetical protein ACKKBG_A09270 [Auxenochlorella protothecoides x Auxenochlorella symbiontica]